MELPVSLEPRPTIQDLLVLPPQARDNLVVFVTTLPHFLLRGLRPSHQMSPKIRPTVWSTAYHSNQSPLLISLSPLALGTHTPSIQRPYPSSPSVPLYSAAARQIRVDFARCW